MAGEAKLGTISVVLNAITSDLEEGLEKAKDELEELEPLAKKVGAAASVAFAVGAASITKMVGIASSAEEQMNVIRTGFGDLTPAIVQWAETTSDAVGRSAFQLRGMAGSMQAMLGPMLGNREAAAGMSTAVAQLAADMGSFFNVADTEALGAIKAGLIGSSEPMRKFGVVMSSASLQSFALSKGIRTSLQSMSDAQKVALRYAFIMDQTALAQGDAARTSQGFANLSKRLSGQIQDLSISFGSALLPMGQKALQVITGFLAKIKALSPETKQLAGLVFAGATAFAGLVAAASAAALVLSPLLAVVGALSIPFVAVAAVVGVVTAVIGSMADTWEEDLGKLKQVVAESVEEIANVFLTLKGIVSDVFSVIGRVTGVSGALELAGSVGELAFGGSDGEGGSGGQGGGDEVPGFFSQFLENMGKGATKIAELTGVADLATGALDALKVPALDLKDPLENFGKFAGEAGKNLSNAGESAIDTAAIEQEAAIAALGGTDRMFAALDKIEMKASEAGGALDEVANGANKFQGQIQITLERFQTSLGEIVSNMSSSMGQVGSLINAAMQGFQQGGIVGAIISVIFQFLTSIKSVQEILDIMNSDLEFFGDALSEFFQPIQGLIERSSVIIRKIFSFIGNALATIADILDPATAIIEGVFEGFSTLLDVLKPITDIMREVGKAFKDLANMIRSFFGDGNNQAKMQMAQNEMALKMAEIARVTELAKEAEEKKKEEIEKTAPAIADMTKAAEKVSQSFTNVPQGFKLAAARFEAIQTDLEFAGGADAMGAGGGGSSAPVHIENVTVATDDPESFLDAMKRLSEWRGFTQNGTTIGISSEFVTGQEGTS